MPTIVKLCMNGASHAVRLTKDFRFDGDEVCIKRVGSAVLIFPKNTAWNLMGGMLGKADDDFMAERDQPTRAEKRKPLSRRRAKRR